MTELSLTDDELAALHTAQSCRDALLETVADTTENGRGTEQELDVEFTDDKSKLRIAEFNVTGDETPSLEVSYLFNEGRVFTVVHGDEELVRTDAFGDVMSEVTRFITNAS